MGLCKLKIFILYLKVKVKCKLKIFILYLKVKVKMFKSLHCCTVWLKYLIHFFVKREGKVHV